MDQTLTTGAITTPTLQRAFGEVDLFIEKGAYVDVFNPVLKNISAKNLLTEQGSCSG